VSTDAHAGNSYDEGEEGGFHATMKRHTTSS
jgi:hypothetical protein